MTETTEKNFQQWTGDGGTTVFSPSSMNVHDEADLAVYVDDTLQTITTHYSVGIVSQVATVTFVSAPGDTTKVTIVREEPLEQSTELTTINTFRAEGFEGALDAIVRQIFRVWHKVTRSLTLPDSNIDGSGQFDARSNRIGNVGDPTAAQDAVTKAYADNTYSLQSAGGGDMFKATYDSDEDGKVNSAVNADIAPWSGLTGVPASFTPASHNHTASEVTDFSAAADARIVASAQAESTWETGTDTTESAVSPAKVKAAIDALAFGGGGGGSGDMSKSTYDSDDDGKVNSAVSADIAPWSGLIGVPASFTPSSHNHTASEITDFNTSADARIAASAQALAIWEAGTGTTASAISPAHVKAAIDALGGSGGGIPQWTTLETDTDISGGASYDVDLPTSYDEFWLEFVPMHNDGAANAQVHALFSIDGGTTVETAGYVGNDTDVAKWYDANAWDADDEEWLQVWLTRVSGTLIYWHGVYGTARGARTAEYHGFFDSGSAADLVRVSPSAGDWNTNSRLTVRAR